MNKYEKTLRATAKDFYSNYYYYQFVEKNNQYAQSCMHDYMIVCDILKKVCPKFNAELCEKRWRNEIQKDLKGDK